MNNTTSIATTSDKAMDQPSAFRKVWDFIFQNFHLDLNGVDGTAKLIVKTPGGQLLQIFLFKNSTDEDK